MRARDWGDHPVHVKEEEGQLRVRVTARHLGIVVATGAGITYGGLVGAGATISSVASAG